MTRDSRIRVNAGDKSAIKECRDSEFDSSVPLGLVARWAAEEVMSDRDDSSSEVRL